MNIVAKKISREAKRNGLDVIDLDNAVKAIQFQKEEKYALAQSYKEVVHEEDERIWEVAGDIAQFIAEQK